MKKYYFKALQRKLKFRNPTHLLEVPDHFCLSEAEIKDLKKYFDELEARSIKYSFPGHSDYPKAFYKMKEPPLFIEFKGEPLWNSNDFISVIGSRQISELSQNWMKNQLSPFLVKNNISVISGGARGVDQWAHLIALKNNLRTVFVLPSGLENLYPPNLIEFENETFNKNKCFLSEFEYNQKVHKSHFYFRNRLIAALGEITLIVQASLKSGSLLTVHHCLENGKPLLVIPSHPEILGFEGNLKLIRDGAYPVANEQDLLDFWNAEFHTK